MTDTPKILIVDDEPTNVKILTVCFQKEGFQVVSATNGAEGFALARTEHPDLILLDIMMPGENGFETCAKLKDDHATMDTPVIFLSAMDDVKNKIEGLSIGAVDYITKPFDRREVIARARLHIKLGRALQALVNEQRSKLDRLTDAQQSLLVRPADLPDAGFDVFYRPMLEAGGDFYDAVRISDGIYGYLVADVSGHDLGAAFVTSALKALFRQNATPLLSPLETMKTINSVLNAMLADGKHLTACYLQVNRLNSRVTVVSAGHPPVLFTNAQEGKAEYLPSEGDVLGPFASIYLKPVERKLAPGDRFYLYTDGLIESPESGYQRGEGRKKLMDACAAAIGLPRHAAIDSVMAGLYPDVRIVKDDIVLLAVEGEAGGGRPTAGGYRSVVTEKGLSADFTCVIENVERFVAEAGALLTVRDMVKHLFAVQLLLREGLNNAVLHGCGTRVGGNISASISLTGPAIEIAIEDDGDGFDWRSLAGSVTDDHAMTGRGFGILRTYATWFGYNEKGNRLMIKLAAR